MWTVVRGKFLEWTRFRWNSVEKSRQGLLELRSPLSPRTTFFRVDNVFNGNLAVWEMCCDQQRILQ